MMDLSYHREIQEKASEKVIMSCTVKLDKKTILEVLGSELIFIDGKYYEVPEKQLISILLNGSYGSNFINFLQVKNLTK